MDEILEHRKYAMPEWESWKSMCAVIGDFVEGDINDSRFYPLVNAIASWGDDYAKLRVYQCEVGRTTIDEIKGLRFGPQETPDETAPSR